MAPVTRHLLRYLSLFTREVWHRVPMPRRMRAGLLHVANRSGLKGVIVRGLEPYALPPVVVVSSVRAEHPWGRITELNSSIYNIARQYAGLAEEEQERIEAAYLASQGKSDPIGLGFLSTVQGDYEEPQRHEHLIDGASYVLVTDSALRRGRATRHLAMDYFDSDPVRRARYVKTHPQFYLPDCRLVVWTDANIIIRGDLRPEIDAFLASGLPIAAVPHPLRSSIYEEAEECILRAKDDASVIRRQVNRYRREGFAHGDLVESNLMMFRMDDPRTLPFLAFWWAEIERGSRRDQLSLNYTAAKAGVRYFPLTSRPNSVRNHPRLALRVHRSIPLDSEIGVTPAIGPPQSSLADGDRAAIRQRKVDIVICVHNALAPTLRCVASVVANRTAERHRIILVDDGSDIETKVQLQQIAGQEKNVVLIRHAAAQGYCKSANAGLRASSGDLVILLDSDTEIAAGMVEKLCDVAFGVAGVGIVGPLSNAASSQSIPAANGSNVQSAINDIPEGLTTALIDAWCEARLRHGGFPRVPAVHSFCFAITRETIERVGYFDEVNFSDGYGEETDYCLRATAAGVGLAVATHTYVYREKSASYGGSRRSDLNMMGSEALKRLYGRDRLRRLGDSMQQNPLLQDIRDAAAVFFDGHRAARRASPTEAPPPRVSVAQADGRIGAEYSSAPEAVLQKDA